MVLVVHRQVNAKYLSSPIMLIHQVHTMKDSIVKGVADDHLIGASRR